MVTLILLLMLCVTYAISNNAGTSVSSLEIIKTSSPECSASGVGNCAEVSMDNCTQLCGCDNWYYFNNSTNQCLLNLKYIIKLIVKRTDMTDITPSSPYCDEVGDCQPDWLNNCTEPCGCDNRYYFDTSSRECVLKDLMIEKYNTEEKIRQSADRVFVGIKVAGYIFVSCACLSALTACVYCCRFNYADYKLNKDVTALARKLQRDGRIIKKNEKKKIKAMAESCNVVVEDAGVFVC